MAIRGRRNPGDGVEIGVMPEIGFPDDRDDQVRSDGPCRHRPKQQAPPAPAPHVGINGGLIV
jgi:hypothetical protein